MIAMTTRCGATVRGSTNRCELEPGHSGHHSTSTFACDGCGRQVRLNRIGARCAEADGEGWIMLCWCCVQPDRSRA